MLSTSKLYNYLFFSFFLIFLRVIPVSIETQPVFSVLFSFLILSQGKIDFQFIKTDVLFTWILVLVLGIYSIYTLMAFKEFSAIVDLVKYLVGPIIYLAIRRFDFKVSIKTLKIVVSILLATTIVTLFLPQLSKFLFSFLISRSENLSGDDYRGISILTPEPSYFSAFVVMLMATIEKKLQQGDEETSERRLLKQMKFAVLFMAVLTKSVYAIFMAVLFFFPLSGFRKNIIKLLFALVLFFISVLVYVEYNPDDRIALLFNVITTVIDSNEIDFLDVLYYQESSGGARFIINWLAVSSFFETPFGKGIGTFPQFFGFYAQQNGLDLASHDVFVFADKYKFYPQTYLANLVHDIGIFSLLIFPIIFLNRDKSNKEFTAKWTICILMLLLFQSQLSNPTLWYLIAIDKQASSEDVNLQDSSSTKLHRFFNKCLSRS